MNRKPKTAIIFDLDDTLLRTSEAVAPHALENVRKVMARLVPEATAQRILARREEVGLAEAIAAERLPTHVARTILDAYIAPLDEPFAYEDIATLDDLKKTCTLFLVTHGVETYQQDKIALHDLGRHFTRIVITDENKKTVFRRLIEKEHLDPKRTFVVGDKYTDELVAAIAVGCTPILIARKKGSHAPKNMRIIVSLRELAHIVETQ